MYAISFYRFMHQSMWCRGGRGGGATLGFGWKTFVHPEDSDMALLSNTDPGEFSQNPEGLHILLSPPPSKHHFHLQENVTTKAWCTSIDNHYATVVKCIGYGMFLCMGCHKWFSQTYHLYYVHLSFNLATEQIAHFLSATSNLKWEYQAKHFSTTKSTWKLFRHLVNRYMCKHCKMW